MLRTHERLAVASRATSASDVPSKPETQRLAWTAREAAGGPSVSMSLARAIAGGYAKRMYALSTLAARAPHSKFSCWSRARDTRSELERRLSCRRGRFPPPSACSKTPEGLAGPTPAESAAAADAPERLRAPMLHTV